MQFNPTPIKLHAAGKLAKTGYVNEVAQAVNDRGSPFVTGTADGEFFPGCTFVAKISDKGPNGEADYTDEKYWVVPQRVDAGMANATSETIDDPGLLAQKAITATNFAEQSAGSVGTGSHALPKNLRVIVDAFTDNSDPPKLRFSFERTTDRSLFPVLTSQTGGTHGDTNTACTFTYNVTDVFSGASLGSAIGVEKPRILKVEMTAGTNGTAYWGMNGTNRALKLWDIGEVMKQNAPCA